MTDSGHCTWCEVDTRVAPQDRARFASAGLTPVDIIAALNELHTKAQRLVTQ